MTERETELWHHGVKGMKWGRRRYQNEDGSLTPAGVKRYARKGYAEDSYNSNKTVAGKVYDKLTDAHKYGGDAMYGASSQKARTARAEKYLADQNAKRESNKKNHTTAKRVAAAGAAVAGTALAAYGAKKFHDAIRDKNFEIHKSDGQAYAKYLFDKNYGSELKTAYIDDNRGQLKRLNNIMGGIYANEYEKARNQANKDSFGRAFKNVYHDYRWQRQNRR